MGTLPRMFVLVVAKEPVAGRVKTRLCPPCTPEQAASLAEAALADTLEAAVSSGADEVAVALDGQPGPWLPSGVRTFAQVNGPFHQRLTAAWAETSGPGIQIGMDTPQVTGRLLDAALDALGKPELDAVLGPADDGGWWIIGLPQADNRVFVDIPMSSEDTGRCQRRRLDQLGYRIGDLPALTDVDHFTDARKVASIAPSTRFASLVRAVDGALPAQPGPQLPIATRNGPMQ